MLLTGPTQQDSNLRAPGLHSGALPTELHAVESRRSKEASQL